MNLHSRPSRWVESHSPLRCRILSLLLLGSSLQRVDEGLARTRAEEVTEASGDAAMGERNGGHEGGEGSNQGEGQEGVGEGEGEEGGGSTSAADEPDYQLIVDCNAMMVDVDNEIAIVHNYIRDK